MSKSVDAALALRKTHPAASPREVLDIVFGERTGATVDFGDIDPRSTFGQPVAAAFDTGMEPSDWRLLDVADDAQRAVLLGIWRSEVLTRFLGHYRLNGCERMVEPVYRVGSVPVL
jgi:hypothetical protein